MWNEDDDNDEQWLDIPYVEEDEAEHPDVLDGGPGEHDAHLTTEDFPFRTVPCSNCGKAVWEEAVACRRCGHHFTDQAYNDSHGAVAEAKSRWAVVLMILLILVMVLACMLGVQYF